MNHSPNCSIYRQGDIRSWCNCGKDKPIKPDEFEAGRLYERTQIVARLRYGVKEFNDLAETNKERSELFGMLADEFEIEAKAIESGDY